MTTSALPAFPILASGTTEDQLERTVCRLIDRADALYLGRAVTPQEYDAWMKALDSWSARQRTAA